MPPPAAGLREVVKVAFAQALPPICLYLVPLIGVAFLLALTFPQRQLRTRAHLAS